MGREVAWTPHTPPPKPRMIRRTSLRKKGRFRKRARREAMAPGFFFLRPPAFLPAPRLRRREPPSFMTPSRIWRRRPHRIPSPEEGHGGIRPHPGNPGRPLPSLPHESPDFEQENQPLGPHSPLLPEYRWSTRDAPREEPKPGKTPASSFEAPPVHPACPTSISSGRQGAA